MGQRTLPGSPSLVEILTLAQRRAVRGLAARLADDGCTLDQWRVLRALGDGEGHLMGELEDTADHLIVIGRGRLVADMSMAKLLAAASKERVEVVTAQRTEALQIAQPTLTRVVESMVDAAWIYRRPSAEDRRRVAVHLSRQGRVRLSRLDAIVKAHEDALLASPDWDEVQTRISGLAGKS